MILSDFFLPVCPSNHELFLHTTKPNPPLLPPYQHEPLFIIPILPEQSSRSTEHLPGRAREENERKRITLKFSRGVVGRGTEPGTERRRSACMLHASASACFHRSALLISRKEAPTTKTSSDIYRPRDPRSRTYLSKHANIFQSPVLANISGP